MKPQQAISVAFRNLWRRKLRTILTIWGMSVGIGAMVLLISFASGLQQQAKESFLGFVSLTELQVSTISQSGMMENTGEPKSFTEDDLDAMRAIPHVTGVFAQVYAPVSSIALNDKSISDFFFNTVPVVAIDTSKRDSIEAGSWWSADDANAVVIPLKAAEQLGFSAADIIGKTLTLKTTIYSPTGQSAGPSYTATVAGVIKPGDTGGFGMNNNSSGSISYNLANQISREVTDEGVVKEQVSMSNVTVYVDSTDNVAAVRLAIEGKEWFVQSAEDMLKQMDQGFLIMKVVLGVMGGIALFVALIGIANSMFMAILERTREIGIFVALGASRRTVSSLFLIEASWIGFLGAASGIVGAWLIGQLIAAGVKIFASAQIEAGNMPAIKFSIDLMLIAATLVGAVLITLLAAWLPSRRAAKQDPVQALRHE